MYEILGVWLQENACGKQELCFYGDNFKKMYCRVQACLYPTFKNIFNQKTLPQISQHVRGDQLSNRASQVVSKSLVFQTHHRVEPYPAYY